VDHGVRAQTDDRPGIGGIHNGIHGHLGNVISDDLKGHPTTSVFSDDSARYLLPMITLPQKNAYYNRFNRPEAPGRFFT
jgi:hypothetical protein